MMVLERASRIRGCLLGGAVGDALGAAIEFLTLEQIRTRFGPEGVLELAPAYGRLGAVTDDTQMTLFTAEGLIRAAVRRTRRGVCNPVAVIHHALARWLHTQGESCPALSAEPDGWLVSEPELFARRSPGATCLSSLRATTTFGLPASNDSKGCGAIMRIAPLGFLVRAGEAGDSQSPPQAAHSPGLFEIACESARSTHGHPDSTYASGYFAVLIAQALRGRSLGEAMTRARRPLEQATGAAGVLQAIAAATELAGSDVPAQPETVERLGRGWVAEEALAISLFCALRATGFEHGVRLAVNHGGDSDSTGSLTGQLLGVLLGAHAIPARWLAELELRSVIEALADDLVAVLEGRPFGETRSYPDG